MPSIVYDELPTKEPVQSVNPHGKSNSILVDLPTKGIMYPKDHPLHNVEKVSLKPLTGEEIDIITNQDYIEQGIVYDMLLKQCVQIPAFDPQTLISVDEFVLIMRLRISGLGYEYTPLGSVKCKKCNYEHEHYTYSLENIVYEDLSDFDIIDEEILEHVGRGEPIRKVIKCVQTVFKGKVVKYKFLTNKDLKAIDEVNNRMKNIQRNSSKLTIKFSELVIEYDGVRDKTELQSIFKNMSLQDSLSILKTLKEPQSSVKSKFVCQSCKHEEDIVVRFDITFLYPRDLLE